MITLLLLIIVLPVIISAALLVGYALEDDADDPIKKCLNRLKTRRETQQ